MPQANKGGRGERNKKRGQARSEEESHRVKTLKGERSLGNTLDRRREGREEGWKRRQTTKSSRTGPWKLPIKLKASSSSLLMLKS